jgi:hypothetical protein
MTRIRGRRERLEVVMGRAGSSHVPDDAGQLLALVSDLTAEQIEELGVLVRCTALPGVGLDERHDVAVGIAEQLGPGAPILAPRHPFAIGAVDDIPSR